MALPIRRNPVAALGSLKGTASTLVTQQARFYTPSKAEIFSMIGHAPNGRSGGFTTPSLGSGLVTIGSPTPVKLGNQFVTATNFLIYADTFKASPKVNKATLVLVKPNGGGTVEIPMRIAKDVQPSINRNWHRIATRVNTEDLNVLRGSATELDFVYRLKLSNGKTEWVNREGKPFWNFAIHQDQMRVGL